MCFYDLKQYLCHNYGHHVNGCSGIVRTQRTPLPCGGVNKGALQPRTMNSNFNCPGDQGNLSTEQIPTNELCHNCTRFASLTQSPHAQQPYQGEEEEYDPYGPQHPMHLAQAQHPAHGGAEEGEGDYDDDDDMEEVHIPPYTADPAQPAHGASSLAVHGLGEEDEAEDDDMEEVPIPHH
ncbi:hypothetical protein PV04_05147 [Phialophora macrospora]|uniref:Uncharacterized protein n=1 Tax=Phialophora macrospora TaxID=1851006 RepID=A0A0D2E4I0_9EURO|nr:hypothetical protein PV04_05147 [Phialophora macrospora]